MNRIKHRPRRGDIILIKPDLIIGRKYNNTTFRNAMEKYTGKEAIITECSRTLLLLDIDGGKHIWSMLMIELKTPFQY